MKIKNRTLIKLIYSSLITISILVFVFLLSHAPLIGNAISYSNLGLRSILFNIKEIPGKDYALHPSLTLVAIDDRTLMDPEFGGLGRWQDFQRTNYAQVIENLNAAGAITIGIDVLFSEKTPEDEALAKVIKTAGNVIL